MPRRAANICRCFPHSKSSFYDGLILSGDCNIARGRAEFFGAPTRILMRFMVKGVCKFWLTLVIDQSCAAIALHFAVHYAKISLYNQILPSARALPRRTDQ